MDFSFPPLKLLNKGKKEYSKIIIFISFHSILLYRKLCHSTSKPISDQEDTLKSFMAFNITSHERFLEWLQGVKLWSPQQSLLHNDTPVTRTHDLDSDIIYWTMSYAIPPQNQLVMRKTHLNLLWHSTSCHTGLFLEWLQGVKLWSPQHISFLPPKRWLRLGQSKISILYKKKLLKK